MVVFNAIASRPDEIGWTFDNSWRKIFHGTSVLKKVFIKRRHMEKKFKRKINTWLNDVIFNFNLLNMQIYTFLFFAERETDKKRSKKQQKCINGS